MRRRLEALSPLGVLGRGYAVVTRKEDGNVISRVAQARAGEQVTIRVSDGQMDAEITDRKS
jgi:exonuclease VII large subunit